MNGSPIEPRATTSASLAGGRGRVFRPPWWVRAKRGEFTWWIRPEWQDPLIGPDGLKLSEWRDRGRLATVKQGPHRIVYRADLPEGSVYVKHYLVPDARAMLRQWFRRGKGRNEGRRAANLEAIGVPTITPIALGEQRRGKFLFENYLITAAIVDTLPLDEFVERLLPKYSQARAARIRRSLAVALGVLTAKLHDAGFLHTDFHPGNILVRIDADDTPMLSMIDLDALRVHRYVSWNDARANLALLNHYFWMRSELTDRHRFLSAYFEARGQQPPEGHSFARGIELSTRRWAERLWTRWGRRCRGSNKYFAAQHAPGAWGIRVRGMKTALMAALIADPDAPFQDPATTIIKQSRTTTVAELTMEIGGAPRQVIYKRFNRKKWLDPLLALFRPSRGWRAWQAGQHLSSRGLPTPQNLAFIARLGKHAPWWPASWLPRDTYVVTVKAEPSVTLGDYVRQNLATMEPSARRERITALAASLALLVRSLHERSVSHRDLKAANILIEGDPTSPHPSLSVIDLVGVQLARPVPRARRIQNLARLYLSLEDCPGRTRTDLLRFLKRYNAGALLPPEDWKGLWRSTAIAAENKRRQNQQRGRRLS